MSEFAIKQKVYASWTLNFIDILFCLSVFTFKCQKKKEKKKRWVKK